MKMHVPYPYGKPYSQQVVFPASALETLIREKAVQLSYNSDEQCLIQQIAGHLCKLVKAPRNFGDSFLGGSFKRGTLAKNLGIINLYFEFIGSGTPRTALRLLQDCLMAAHPDLKIRQENSTIKLEFEGIPYTLTPYLKSTGHNIKIPNETLSGWKSINVKLLEANIRSLTIRSKEFLHLIKVLKLWNYTHKTGLKNYRIEELVCNLFITFQHSGPSVDYWLYNFFNHYRYHAAAETVRELMKLPADHPELKMRWEQFIENKQTQGWA